MGARTSNRSDKAVLSDFITAPSHRTGDRYASAKHVAQHALQRCIADKLWMRTCHSSQFPFRLKNRHYFPDCLALGDTGNGKAEILMKRATLPQIQQSRLKIINDGDVPSPAAVARELGRTFSPASIVIGLRQIESREIRRFYLAERIQHVTEAEGGSSNQILRDRLSKSEKLVANLKVRVDILERRERSLNRGYTKAERKLAKSRYRNRDYRDAMSKLAAEIITLEAALRKTGESWQPEHLSIPEFARARLQDGNKTRLIALRYSSQNRAVPNTGIAEQRESINEPVDSLCSRLLSALSMREEHQNLIYNALRSYDSENRRLLKNIKSLEQRILVLNQNQRRTSQAFSHLWPEELIKSTLSRLYANHRRATATVGYHIKVGVRYRMPPGPRHKCRHAGNSGIVNIRRPTMGTW